MACFDDKCEDLLIGSVSICLEEVAGWWHAVLNLDLTVAVTHNYCATSNFDAVWRHTRRGRPKLSVKWLAALEQVRSGNCRQEPKPMPAFC